MVSTLGLACQMPFFKKLLLFDEIQPEPPDNVEIGKWE